LKDGKDSFYEGNEDQGSGVLLN